eukprot:scaffold29380_cov70-Phaeocystis_antarctica.AAC.4
MTGRHPAPMAEYSRDEMYVSPAGMRQKTERAMAHVERHRKGSRPRAAHACRVRGVGRRFQLRQRACHARIVADGTFGVVFSHAREEWMATSAWSCAATMTSATAHRIFCPEQHTSREPEKETSSGLAASGAASYCATPCGLAP